MKLLQIIAGRPSLTKPSTPKEVLVQMLFRGTTASLKIRKPVGKCGKVSNANCTKRRLDLDPGVPVAPGLAAMPSLATLMGEREDRMVFASWLAERPGTPPPYWLDPCQIAPG